MAPNVVSPGRKARPKPKEGFDKALHGIMAGISARPIALAKRAMTLQSLQRQLLAGIPVVVAFKSLAGLSRGRVGIALARIAAGIESGLTLADATRLSPQLFPGTSPDLVGAAEHTGSIPDMLDAMVRTLKLQAETRRRLLKSFAYPIFLVLSACLLLPLPRLVSCGPGGYIAGMGKTALPFMALGMIIFGAWVVMLIPAPAMAIRRIVRHLPLSGSAIRDRALFASLQTIGLALQAGLGISQSLRLGAIAADDDRTSDAWKSADMLVRKGLTLSASLHASLPDDIAVSIGTGEKTGNLPEAILESASLAWTRYQARLTTLARIASIILSAIVVSMIAFSIVQSFVNVLNLGGNSALDMEMMREMRGVMMLE